jgi:hypothetical protein
MQGKSSYIARLALDQAIARCLKSGAGVYALEGPGGAGKSTALLHGLGMERERRGKGGRGHVRILQLWGDEPPSLFSQRLVREVGLLNLLPYPQPDQLAKLVADMAEAIPGLSTAGKVLSTLIPDDLRPLPVQTAEALGEAGKRAIAQGGPLCIGVDLLGGDVSAPVRDFFTRLCELLPPTVVLLFAQPGGQTCLLQVPPEQRIAVGPFTEAEARAFLEERFGPLDAKSQSLLATNRLSLLPGDLAQIVNLSAYLGGEHELSEVLPSLERDISARYQQMFESMLAQPSADGRVLELCAICAVTARPQQPLSLELALKRMEHGSPLRPSDLAQIRQAPLIRALCVSAGVSWPLEPASAQARDGVRTALLRHGLLDVYEQRWLRELQEKLRRSQSGGAGPEPDGLLAGTFALSLLTERAIRDPLALGAAVNLLAEMETLLWRAGWHRAFAELYDALLPHLRRAGVSPRDVAPRLWFRRARTRIQSIDWTGEGGFSAEELGRAEQELDELGRILEAAVVKARVAIGLSTDGEEVRAWCQQLPWKARQARGYAGVLRLLFADADSRQKDPQQPSAQERWDRALDDILAALGHFSAAHDGENIAQTLTIVGDLYSVSRGRREIESDRLALHQYEQAVLVAEHLKPLPAFCLGMIYRALGNHHRRRGRVEKAEHAYALARRYLLRSPDARMGTLLAGLLPLTSRVEADA